MAKLNPKRASYFAEHKGTKQFYFTSDDRASFTEEGATAHAKALKAGKKKSDQVDLVTREEYDAWVAEQAPTTDKGIEEKTAPTPMELLKAAWEAAKAKAADKAKLLAEHKAKIATLIGERDGLPADTSTAKKNGAALKVTNAEAKLPEIEKAVTDANAEVTVAEEALAALEA